jgi:tRNA A37 methylthiotransferase MiaB
MLSYKSTSLLLVCVMLWLHAMHSSTGWFNIFCRTIGLCIVKGFHRYQHIYINVSMSGAGFCGETEEDHEDTIKLLEAVGYDMAYMFAYSMREKTHAHRNYEDDVPEPVKQRRLAEMITTFRQTTLPRFESQLGTTQLVLVEGPNKRAPDTELVGKSDKGHRVIFPKTPVLDGLSGAASSEDGCDPFIKEKHCQAMVDLKPGDFVEVHIAETTHASLRGEPLLRTSITQFSQKYQ